MSLEPSQEPPATGLPTYLLLRVFAWSLVLFAVGLLVLITQRGTIERWFNGTPPAPVAVDATPEHPLAQENTPALETAAPPLPPLPPLPLPAPAAQETAPPAETPPPAETLPSTPPNVPEPSPAESSPATEPVPTPEISQTPVSVVDVPVLASPESLLVEVRQDGTVSTQPAATQEELLREIKRLQDKFDQLQETVNLVVTQMMSDVEDENQQLRSELRRLQAREQAGLLNNATVPRPGGELIAGLAEDAATGVPLPTPEELEAQAPLPSSEFSFNVLKEWGREPEAVAELGGDAPTLKGVIGVVPRGATREDIENLGRELREQYGQYDNINVEVFDDPVAAQAFVDTQEIDSQHRVLSVSKYSATGRDNVTYYEDGQGTDIAVGAMLSNAENAPADADVTTPTDGTTLENVEAVPAESESPNPEENPATPKPRGRRSAR